MQIIKSFQKNPLLSTVPGLVLALVVYSLVPDEMFPKAPIMAGIMVLMAFWWIQDVIPIPVTSLVPIFAFPLFGLSDLSEVSVYYGRPIIFLFLGGFILALGLQNSGVHKRLSLVIINWIGTRPNQLILGFMLVSGFMSMWISNTASVMVMLPIGLSVIENIKRQIEDETLLKNFSVCFMLGIAYSANIGGMATLIGTPPNLIFLEMYHQLFPVAKAVGFLDWMMIGAPLSFVFVLSGWYLLTHFIYKLPQTEFFDGKRSIYEHLKELGPIRRDEILTLSIFGLAAFLWITASDIDISEDFVITGWRTWLGLELFTDPGIAILCASLMFIIPSNERENQALLSWKVMKELPWGILLLFGGGFAMAGGFEFSGLGKMLQSLFISMPLLPPLLIITIVCVFVTFQTEITSNSAVTTLILPILAAGSTAFGMDPKFLMMAATLSASCAFMMPIATPPAAIVYGSGYVTIKQMIRAGIWFNVLGLVLTIAMFSLIHYLS